MNRDCHWFILGHMALTIKIQMYPDRDTLPVFTFEDEHNKGSTIQTWNLKLKTNDFQSYPWRETPASGGKRRR